MLLKFCVARVDGTRGKPDRIRDSYEGSEIAVGSEGNVISDAFEAGTLCQP
jgi:hypothetical protein